jgi:lysozyme
MLTWLKALLRRKEMDMDTIIKRLEFHEGCVLKPYYCPTGHLTIGIGHNTEARAWTDEERKAIGDWKQGITKNMAYMICRNDVNLCLDKLKTLDFWKSLDEERQYALIDLCFQLGWVGLKKFKKMLKALTVKDYLTAAAELLDSKYATQTPKRAKRIANLIKTGVWEI